MIMIILSKYWTSGALHIISQPFRQSTKPNIVSKLWCVIIFKDRVADRRNDKSVDSLACTRIHHFYLKVNILCVMSWQFDFEWNYEWMNKVQSSCCIYVQVQKWWWVILTKPNNWTETNEQWVVDDTHNTATRSFAYIYNLKIRIAYIIWNSFSQFPVPKHYSLLWKTTLKAKAFRVQHPFSMLCPLKTQEDGSVRPSTASQEFTQTVLLSLSIRL